MKKTVHLLILMALMAMPSFADKVSKSEAQRIAEKFMAQSNMRKGKARFAATPKTLKLSRSTSQDYAPFYVYNVENNGGFVIVSGEDALGTILGYSDSGSFEMEDAPSNIVTMLQMFARAAENAGRQANSGPKQDAVPSKGTVVVAPLLGNIQWGQDKPFNAKMPEYTADGVTRNYYVGCVATAMAQIMRFHKYPQQGIGTETYQTKYGTPATTHTLTANYGATTYNWNNMPEYLEQSNTDAAQNEQVATLSYQAAVGVHMSFAPGGSGSYSQGVTGALVNHFGYDKGISYKKREYFSTKEWMDMIKKELDARRPVFYSASNEDGMGGHAYVCDGYDNQDYVHINWGWYGKSNGYFYVNALNPYDLGIGANGGGYNLQQEIIIGIQPPVADSKKQWAIYGATRLAVQEVNGEIMALSIVESHDCDKFEGKIAAVLVNENSKVVYTLKDQAITFDGVNLDGKSLCDGEMVSLSKISKSVPSVANGQYKVMFAVQANGSSDWTIVRMPNGKPNYGEATVESGMITSVKQHVTEPNDIQLLEKITPDGALYAKGSGNFRVNVRNNTKDFYLTRVWLKFTSVTDPSKVYFLHEDSVKTNNVYDGSDKVLNLLINLPEEMEAGDYNVVAFEKGFEQYPFKEDLVGPTVLKVLDKATTPIIRQIGNFAWLSGGANEKEILQGDKIVMTQPLRNYGIAGKAALLLKAVSIDDPSKEINFFQIKEQAFEQQQLINPQYITRVDLNPGKYNIVPYYIVDGTEYPMEGDAEKCIIEVKGNAALPLICTEFFTPTTEMVQGKRYNGLKISLKAKTPTKGIVYVRLRPATYKEGELATMKTINLAADGTMDITFNYTPKSSLLSGKYLLYVEYRPNGVAVGKEITISGENTKEIYLGITQGIEDVNNNEDVAADFSVNGKQISFENAQNVRKVEVYTLTGAQVYATSAVPSTLSLPVANGVYVVRIATTGKTMTRKIVLR